MLLIFYVFFLALYIELRNGKKLLMVNSYTFNVHSTNGKKQRWQCSSLAKGCNAVVYTLDDKVISYKNTHKHEPPKYMCVNGKFIKI